MSSTPLRRRRERLTKKQISIGNKEVMELIEERIDEYEINCKLNRFDETDPKCKLTKDEMIELHDLAQSAVWYKKEILSQA